MGTTPAQLLTKLRLPLALPEILLGLNQTILLAISMLVITALVGTRDLGQEVYIALTKADVGQRPRRRRLHRHDRDDRRPADDRAPPPAPAPGSAWRDDPGRGRPRRRRPADLDRPGRPAAAGRRHHQPQLHRRRRRPPLPGADRRRHPRAHGRLRRFELAASRAAHAAGLAPAVRHAEPGALVLDFIEGRTFTAADVRDPANLDRLADLVRRCHREIPSTSAARRRSSGCSRSSATTPTPSASAARPRAAPRRRRDAGGGRRPGRDRLRPQRPPARQHHRRRHAASGWSTGNMPASTPPLFDLGGLASNAGMTADEARALLDAYFGAAARRRPPPPGRGDDRRLAAARDACGAWSPSSTPTHRLRLSPPTPPRTAPASTPPAPPSEETP